MSRGIPEVRRWKVTAKDTGKVIYVDTINKKFARWIANTERGMWNHDLTISVVKEKHTCQPGGAPCHQCRKDLKKTKSL